MPHNVKAIYRVLIPKTCNDTTQGRARNRRVAPALGVLLPGEDPQPGCGPHVRVITRVSHMGSVTQRADDL